MVFFRDFLQIFIPLFVAIDAFGLVPVFLAVTNDLSPQRRREVTFEAVLVASVISIGFMFIGQALFGFLRIDERDFRIAGGILLLVLAVLDLITTGKPAVHEPEIVGIVPLGMPLIAGPATLTTALVLADQYGHWLTLFALVVNFAILLGVMVAATKIERLIGTNALRAFSKLVMVLLAAIAVNFIRTGIESLIRGR